MEIADTPALLVLDLPAQALAGIDLLSFTVTPRFHGVRDLPSGLHFVFAGTSTAFSERHGIWFRVPSGNSENSLLTITRWDTTVETLVSDTDEANNLRWRANLGGIWREGLTPYRQTSTTTITNTSSSEEAEEEEQKPNDWPTLTSHITASLLSRITNSSPQNWHLSSGSSAKRDLEEIPGLTSSDKRNLLPTDKELSFLPINLRQTWPSNATGRERTEAAQDRSWALTQLSDQHCTDGDPNEILGEMQFSFLMILTINNFSSLEQWKRILQLILTCKKAVNETPHFFINALAILRLQLQHCGDAEGGLIDLSDESGSWLQSLLLGFRNGLESMTTMTTMTTTTATTASSSSTAIPDVLDELDDLEDYLRHEHGWQFGGDFVRSGVLELEDGERVEMDFEGAGFDVEDETGEYAPMIVVLTQEQKRLLGLSGDEDVRGVGVRLERVGLVDGVEGVVVDSEEEEEDDSDYAGEVRSEDSGEEMQDLDEMDSRY